MQSFPEPRVTTNPYLVMLRDSLAANEEMEIRVFSWRDALLRRFNVFHVHWPELLLTGTSPRRSLAKQLLMLVLLIKVTLLRTPVVRTLHNTGRHEGLSGLQHALLDLLDRRTTSMIVLNESPVSTSCPS
ncbi:MAG TPA: glycosyl transferase, partial [Propionibacteriaceae bacterium]